MTKCSMCGKDMADGKCGFRMEAEAAEEKRTALFCKECGLKMREEFVKKINELKKAKAADIRKL